MNGKLLGVVIVFAVVLGAFEAQAVTTASCEVLTISATNSGQGIDPALSEFAPIFKQDPFTKFDTFKLVNKQTHQLVLSIPKQLTLPDSLGGFLRLNSINNGKLNLTLTLIRQSGKPIDINGVASFGSPFFAAGLSKSDGVWIFGVLCKNNGIVSH